MASSSFNLEDLSPKSRLMMEYMKKLKAKMEKLEGGMESMKIDSHSSKKKEKEEERKSKKYVSSSNSNDDVDSYRSHKRDKCPKKNLWDLLKGKIPSFSGSDSVDDYYDWELKVSQNLECINCKDLTKVKLIVLVALVWWNEIVLKIRGMRIASIESWEELKQEMKERFVPLFYKRDLFVKLQKMYQGVKSVEEYFKEMEVTRHGRKSYLTSSSYWRGKEKKEEKFLRKDKSPKKGNAPLKGHQEEVSKSQCPNKMIMVLRYDGDIINNESSHEEASTSSSEDHSNEEVSFEGDLPVKMVNHNEKIYFIRDVWSRVLIEQTLCKDKDEILCNVVPMEVIHILLGRPWRFNRKVTHDSVTNKVSFEHKGKKGNF
ncbi:hypothetical protein CR513_33682, partial [Mucuna pruriens]